MNGHWDERYAKTEGAYGRKPTPFWVQELSRCKGHSVLLPCEGEGRNALWAAQQGWKVHAVDSSAVGMATCDRWCKAAGVEDHVQTHIEDALTFEGDPEGYDVVGLFYAHMPALLRRTFHQKAIAWLKPGGKLVLEGFSIDQLGLTSGGPKKSEMLFQMNQLKSDFNELAIEHLAPKQTHLDEGPFHQGKAEIIQLVGTAPIL
jgi:hypothetical protein